MNNILNRLELSDLESIVGYDTIQQMKDLVNDENNKIVDKELLINALLAIYGKDLLSEKTIRHLIFNTIDENLISKITLKYTNKRYSKKYDNSLELSLLPWKVGSEFVNEIAQILDISYEYLPQPKPLINTTFELKPNKILFPLFQYQNVVKQKVIENLEFRTKKFLIQMPTGSGKTRTTLQSLIEYYENGKSNIYENEIILWLAHTEELCDQALDTFVYLWPHLSNRSINISRCWGSFEPSIDDLKGGMVFGTLQKFVSLYNSKSYILEFISKNLKILVIDEAHKSIATSYSQVINFLIKEERSTLIGVTATPGRNSFSHTENMLLSSFFNKVLIAPDFNDNPIKELQRIGVLSRLKRTVINTNLTISLNNNDFNKEYISDLPNSTINKLAINNLRNKKILDLIENEIRIGNPCLVFSCNNEHSRLLNAALNLKKIKSNYIDFKTTSNNRKQIISDFKESKFDVLINYGILSTGFDAPRIRSIIVTRPTTSIVLYSQIIGRGLRGPKMGGGEECNLFDIKDNFENFGGVDEVYNFFDGYWD